MTRKQKYLMWLLLNKHIWIAIWVSENCLNELNGEKEPHSIHTNEAH